MKGKVHQISIKPRTPNERGLPKTAVAQAYVNEHGVEGDYNLYRETKVGGDPDMAVLIMPLETLEELNREGWPVKPGDVGENITTSGFAYDRFSPDLVLRIGEELQLQISKACDPCTNLYKLNYVGKDKGPEFIRTLVGRRGWYARVVRPGKIRAGDDVIF